MRHKFEVIQGGRTPSEVEEQRAIDGFVQRELGYFADQLCTARAIFRDYPELVTAENFPEHLITPLAQETSGRNPEECTNYNGAPFATEEVRAQAIEQWFQSRRRSA